MKTALELLEEERQKMIDAGFDMKSVNNFYNGGKFALNLIQKKCEILKIKLGKARGTLNFYSNFAELPNNDGRLAKRCVDEINKISPEEHL